jgi:tRNA-binding EMAP/Myf-like protein
MSVVRGKLVSKDKMRVEIINFKQDKATEVGDVVVEYKAIPAEPEYVRGKQPVLYCNPMTRELWYELHDRPLTADESAAVTAEAMLEIAKEIKESNKTALELAAQLKESNQALQKKLEKEAK